MNKDIKGLLVYLLCIIAIVVLSAVMIGLFAAGSVSLFMSSLKPEISDAIPIISFFVVLVAIVFYVCVQLVCPAILTVYAIVTKLSKYLDCFFSSYFSVFVCYAILVIINVFYHKYVMARMVPNLGLTLYTIFVVNATSIFVTLTIYNLILFVKRKRNKEAEKNE